MKKVYSCRPDGTRKRERRRITTSDRIARALDVLQIDKQEYAIAYDLRLLNRKSVSGDTNAQIK